MTGGHAGVYSTRWEKTPGMDRVARKAAALGAQNDPRQFGQGHVFDEYVPTSGAGSVNETDFDKQPIAIP